MLTDALRHRINNKDLLIRYQVMSHANDADSVSSPRTYPRSADQHALWQARTVSACWSAAGMDILSLKDNDCDKATADYIKTRTKDSKEPMEILKIITLAYQTTFSSN